MLSTFFFLTVVGGYFVLHVESSAVYKCDKGIIESVKASWNGDIPNDILEKALSYGKLYLKATTLNYMKSEYKGAYSYFSKEPGNVFTKQTVYRIPKDGSKDAKMEFEFIETGGAYKGKSDKQYRYPLYSDNGVIACYTCIDSDDAPEGPAAGFILVKASDYCEDSYKTALSDLKKRGVDACVEYSYE